MSIAIGSASGVTCLVTQRLARRIVAAVGAVLSILAASAGTAAAQSPQISTIPALFPAFNPSVTGYIARCQPSNQLQVSVSAPVGDSVSVDNAPGQTGSFTQNVALTAGQEFQITSTESGQTATYYVRCLPSDFPAFTATRAGPTQAAFYVVTPSLYLTSLASYRYVAFFDSNGVPVWWMKSTGTTSPNDAKLLASGDVVWTHTGFFSGGGAEEHRLDGTLVRVMNTVGSPSDHHDIQLLSNGDYVMGRTFTRSGVDMSGCGGSTSGKLMDFELQELTPSGGLVWSWLASAHIPVSEVPPEKRYFCRLNGDAYHWNAVEPDASGYVLSFRNLDAVFQIDRATGAVQWKLGGTSTPESLSVTGDPFPTICSQHDVRVLPDGSVTIFDNGSGCNRPPRTVRYAIDTTARTATLLQSLTFPTVPYSWCCGSTRLLPGGNWVTDWGASRYVTEQTPTGAAVFKLTFTQGQASYRANPVLPGQVGIAALRAGMDAQYPR